MPVINTAASWSSPAVVAVPCLACRPADDRLRRVMPAVGQQSSKHMPNTAFRPRPEPALTHSNAEQMPSLRPGGTGGRSHRLGSIKELDSSGSGLAAVVTAADVVTAEKQALRRLIRPGARDSADGDPESLVTVSSPAGGCMRVWRLQDASNPGLKFSRPPWTSSHLLWTQSRPLS